MQMKAVPAVKKFIELGTSKPVDIQEMMAFWKGCNPEERLEFGLAACKELGETLET
jgi:uncharacterized membrane protein YebE (DUF533 family)